MANTRTNTISKTKNNFEELLQNIDLETLAQNNAVLPTNTIAKKTSTKKTIPKPTTNTSKILPETPQKTATVRRNTAQNTTTAPDLPAISDIFTSSFVKGIVLFLIIAFNVVLLKNCFLLTVSTRQNFSGNTELDAFLYGLAISMLMTIVLFHEENWQNGFCAGAMTLYINLAILMLYTRLFEFLIGVWWSLWLMSSLVILLPVVGLFVMVVMLKNR